MAGPGGDADPPAPGRLTVIGTGHVFRIGEAVRNAVVALQPDLVFLELDRGRLQALLARRAGAEVPEPEGWLHRRLQRLQEGIAGMYGADVGSEMLAAHDGARLAGARLLLIDPPAHDTLRRLLREITWRERGRAAGLVLSSPWRALRSRGQGKAAVEAEIRRYQEDPERILGELRRDFPTVHRIVIEERDERMAAAIRAGLAGARHGVAVLGDGHVGGVLRRLAGLDVRAYRLADVRAGRLPRPLVARGDSASVRFGFDLGAPPPQP